MSRTICVKTLALLALCCVPTGCLTPAMWEAVREHTGKVTRQERFQVTAMWSAGHNRLGIETTKRGDIRHLLLTRKTRWPPHPDQLLHGGRPTTCMVHVRRKEDQRRGAHADLEIAGVVHEPIRWLLAEPAATKSMTSPVDDYLGSLRALIPKRDPTPARLEAGGWLLDGKATRDLDLVTRAFGDDQEPPDFALLRRIELWARAANGDKSVLYAARGDALWLRSNVSCTSVEDGVQWSQLTQWQVALDARGPRDQELRIPVPVGAELQMTWHAHRNRFWPTVGALLATPVTFAVDCALVGTAVVFILETSCEDRD